MQLSQALRFLNCNVVASTVIRKLAPNDRLTHLRVIPHRNIRPCLSHRLRDSIPNTISGTGDNNYLPAQTQLLQHVVRGVGERPGKAISDDGTILDGHGHVDGVMQVAAVVA